MRALKQTGLSLVELLVGVAVGLLLLGGAAKLFVDSVSDSRRLIVETRVNQDLRAAADLIARDLRRSGYWQEALAAAAPSPPASAASNPYAAVTVTGAASSAELTYSFSRDAVAAENNAINTAGPNENFGFRLEGGAIRTQTADGVWQEVTDPGAVVVTRFAVTPSVTNVSSAANGVGCPVVQVRRYDIVIGGRSPGDDNIVREIRESVRLRNDGYTPCP
jgi:type IV pilus assembly protein PilW